MTQEETRLKALERKIEFLEAWARRLELMLVQQAQQIAAIGAK